MMAEKDQVLHPTDEHAAPKVVAPTTRVSVAFPFSHLHIDESSNDLAELVRIVAHLASIVEGIDPGPEVEELRAAADVLTAKLQ